MKRILSLAVLALAFVGLTSAQTAEEVLRKHIEAVGGEEAWSNVKTSHAKASMSLEIPQGVIVMDVEIWAVYPGHVLLTTTPVSVPDGLPDLSSTIYLSPDGSWSKNFQGHQDLPENAGAPGTGGGVPSPYNPLTELDLLAAMDTLSVEFVGQEQVNGKTANVIEVAGVVTSKRFYDAETGLLLATSVDGGPNGSARTSVSEYMDVEGLKLAMITEGTMAFGKQTMAFTLYEPNADVTPEQLAEMAGGNN